MTCEDRRTTHRLPISLPVKARFGRTKLALQTLDVSHNGAFIVSPQPPSKGQLVHIAVILPTEKKPLTLQGMVMRVVSGEEARESFIPAGFAMEFYGLGRTSQTAWIEYVEGKLRQQLDRGGISHPPTPSLDKRERDDRAPNKNGEPNAERTSTWDQVKDDPTGEWVRPSKEALVSFAPTPPPGVSPIVYYRVCPPTPEGVRGFRRSALEAGGVTLMGTAAAPPGTPAVVAVVHPVTHAEFHVPGEILPSRSGPKSVSVKFNGITDWTKTEFERFARQGRPPTAISGELAPPGKEMVIFESSEEAQWDVVMDHQRAVLVESLMPLQTALDPFRKTRL